MCMKAVLQFPSQQQHETKNDEGQKRTFFIRLSKPSPKSGIAQPVAHPSSACYHALTQKKENMFFSFVSIFPLANAAALRITLNIDGAPIASTSHTHTSHSQTSRLLTSYLLMDRCVYWHSNISTSFHPFSSPHTAFRPFPHTFVSVFCLSDTSWVFILSLHWLFSSS